MRPLATVVAILAFAAAPASAQVSIDFEGTVAPCYYYDDNATPLTNQYSAQGVTFSGNGIVFDECAGFEVFHPHSGKNYAGYTGIQRPRSESITFSSAQSYFEIYIGGSLFPKFTYFLGGTAVATANYAPDTFRWTQITYSGAFDRVDIQGVSQLDDLTTRALATPEPSSLMLLATGMIGLATFARRRAARAA